MKPIDREPEPRIGFLSYALLIAVLAGLIAVAIHHIQQREPKRLTYPVEATR